MHSLLARQIKRHAPLGAVPESLRGLFDAVDEAYGSFEADRALCERSMEIASRELEERNAELTLRNGQVQAAHAELQSAHEGLQRLADELEARVTERTRELRAVNQQLTDDIAKRQEIEKALREAESKYRLMFESATVGIFQTTAAGYFLAANPALARIYGYESPEDLRSRVLDIKAQLYVDQDTRPRFVRLMEECGRVTAFEARVYRKDGSIIWISETARMVRDALGNFLFYEGFVDDITARKQAEEGLRESEERYVLAVRGANDGLWDWNLRTGQVFFSTRWKEMIGCGEEQVGQLPEEWFKRVHPEDLESVTSAIAAHREGLTPHFQVEHRMMHSDGRYRWMLSRGSAIRDGAGKATRMAGSQSDVTVRKEAEEQLLRDAFHDGLTGLPNRALFTDRLERSIARTARDANHHFAVLFLDLDRFKMINDSLGHNAGDQLLVAFAQRLTQSLRPADTVARLGGDEFTVLLEDPREPDDAVGVADRIIEGLRKPFTLGTQEVFIGTSIGIALSNSDYTRPQDVLRDADTAMYRAKAMGKSRCQVFDNAMHARAVRMLQVENDLRRAIDRNEFELHYQPILQMGTRRLRGFEALVRWRHPERGLISPADFIPVAEETGLIIPLGRWVLGEACRQTAKWHATFPEQLVDINVNLSGKQFSQGDLVEQVVAVLRETQLPAKHLILEITESVVMENPEATISMLHRLKAIGVQLNIDDFGTGYSSLAYLQRFPVDAMKIDRSFISRIGQNPENNEIVKTIIALAHNLNMKVTAEGIETSEQLAHLESLSCESAQGYYLSRPVMSGAATEMLDTARAAKAPDVAA
jgi:diguanylate cyclase (GGDEF)-like protein/PAS domain S-box-containing protein